MDELTEIENLIRTGVLQSKPASGSKDCSVRIPEPQVFIRIPRIVIRTEVFTDLYGIECLSKNTSR